MLLLHQRQSGVGVWPRMVGKDINNNPPFLLDKETEHVKCLKEILSSSKAVIRMNKNCLVRASLSPAPRGMT